MIHSKIYTEKKSENYGCFPKISSPSASDIKTPVTAHFKQKQQKTLKRNGVGFLNLFFCFIYI